MNRSFFAQLILIFALCCGGIANAASAPSLVYVGSLVPNQLPADVNYAATADCVDVAGNLAVVTAGRFFSEADAGRAYVFNIANPSSPTQIAELRASDHQPGDEFGLSIAMTDRYVFVGAHGANNDAGAVYMYDMSDPAHITERKITAFDGAADNHFGYALAVSGNRLIAGAPKFNATSLPQAAYVLDFSDPNHITQTKLLPTPGSTGGNFAEQVDIGGNYAIVGHISESSQFPFNGAAHLYDLADLNNIRQKKLLATDINHISFGQAVSVDGTRALVSVASPPGNLSGYPEGAVWAFDFSNWNSVSQTEFGRQPVGSYVAPFGEGMDLVSTTAVLGACNDGPSGAVYLYNVANASNPVQIQRVGGPAGSQTFGRSIDFDGRFAVISDSTQHAYLYMVVPEPGCGAVAIMVGLALLVVRRNRCNFLAIIDRGRHPPSTTSSQI